MLLNEELKREYGVIEYNKIPKGYHDIERDFICWDEIEKTDKVKAERIRFVTDRGFPMLDLSYCHLFINGKRYNVTGCPFTQISKKNWKSDLIRILKEEGIYIKDLFNPEIISILF